MKNATLGLFLGLSLVSSSVSAMEPVIRPTIAHGVDVPDSEHFPLWGPFGFVVGPRVIMTAAHVLLRTCRKSHCTIRDFNYQGQDLSSVEIFMSEDYLKNPSQHFSTPSDFGGAADWALLIMPPEVPSYSAYLTLDLNPPKADEKAVVIGKGHTDEGGYKPGFSSKAALYTVREVDEDSAWLVSDVDNRYTMTFDSGSPWLRVHPDSSVTVVGAHSSGSKDQGWCDPEGNFCLPKYAAGIGLFQREKDWKRITQIAMENHVGICGVTLDCPKVLLPVPLNDLRH